MDRAVPQFLQDRAGSALALGVAEVGVAEVEWLGAVRRAKAASLCVLVTAWFLKEARVAA